MQFEYDEIFGMDLGEYCSLHNVGVDDLIRKTEIDIDILKRRLKQVFSDPMNMGPLEKEIYRLIGKKERHRERLRDWLNQSRLS